MTQKIKHVTLLKLEHVKHVTHKIKDVTLLKLEHVKQKIKHVTLLKCDTENQTRTFKV